LGRALTEPAQLTPEQRAQWVCEANFIVCRHDHLLRFHSADYVIDQRRVDGHVFLGCKKCEPTSFFFGVVTSRPSPIVTCYAISKEQFHHWNDPKADLDLLPTGEMLHRFGYNPRWRQPRNG
jgi:hypothetical protein